MFGRYRGDTAFGYPACCEAASEKCKVSVVGVYDLLPEVGLITRYD
jgi:hypothetical protein